jgi:hypothetical protein
MEEQRSPAFRAGERVGAVIGLLCCALVNGFLLGAAGIALVRVFRGL